MHFPRQKVGDMSWGGLASRPLRGLATRATLRFALLPFALLTSLRIMGLSGGMGQVGFSVLWTMGVFWHCALSFDG